MQDVENMIADWHIKTFPNATRKAILDKLVEELRELFFAIKNDNHKEIRFEMADVAIVMQAYLARGGESLSQAMTKKMLVNVVRQWGEENEQGDRPRVKE